MKYFIIFDGKNYFKACAYDDLSTIYTACFELTKEEYESIQPSQIPYYFDGEQWRSRPTWSHDLPITTTEEETVTFNLPTDYTELRINNSPVTENKWAPPGPGTYTVRVEPFPYMPIDIEIQVTETLSKAQERQIKKLENDCHRYIISHYPETRQHTFKAKYIQIVDELTNNSSNYTQEQIDNLTLAKNRMLEAMNWVDSVLDHFYTKLDEIKSATTVEDVYMVGWDFSQFDDSDPGVTIEEIRNLLKGILW